MDPERERLNRILKQRLFTERQMGIQALPEKEWDEATGAGKGVAAVEGTRLTWDQLEEKANACQDCGLCEKRNSVVFGEGNRDADLLFIGEGPGYEEDKQGRPFVGKAGQLLTRIIEAMGLRRADVYIANCVKCRPPGNRNPLPDEIAMCRKYLERQIQLIQPKVICALGKFAAQTLLESERPIGRMRGVFHDYQGILLMPTFHPAYLLRNPADKKLVWEDVKQIMKELGLAVPSLSKTRS